MYDTIVFESCYHLIAKQLLAGFISNCGVLGATNLTSNSANCAAINRKFVSDNPESKIGFFKTLSTINWWRSPFYNCIYDILYNHT